MSDRQIRDQTNEIRERNRQQRLETMREAAQVSAANNRRHAARTAGHGKRSI